MNGKWYKITKNKLTKFLNWSNAGMPDVALSVFVDVWSDLMDLIGFCSAITK